MASDNAKTKTEPAAKAEPAKAAASPSAESAAKPAAAESSAAPSSYSRGEGQKPVTAAYKENWNAIFAKKKTKEKIKSKKKSR